MLSIVSRRYHYGNISMISSNCVCRLLHNLLVNPSVCSSKILLSTAIHKMPKTVVKTSNAPQPIGPYSQAIKIGETVYLSGQIPVDPKSGKLIEGGITDKAQQVFTNLKAVANAAGGDLSDVVKLTIFITDFTIFGEVNAVMATFFNEPYPARSTVAVKELPLKVPLEVEGIMVIPSK